MCAYRKPASKASPAPVVSIGVTGNARLYTRSIQPRQGARTLCALLQNDHAALHRGTKLATARDIISVGDMAKFRSVGQEEIELGDHGEPAWIMQSYFIPAWVHRHGHARRVCNSSGVRRLQRGEEAGYVQVFGRVSAQNGRKIRRA